MSYGLFVGCIASCRYPGIETTTRFVLDKLGVEYTDVEGFSCCPAPGVTQSFDKNTWLALAARNLSLAEEKNLGIMTLCNGCFGSLFEASHILANDGEKLKRVNEILGQIGRRYNGNTKVYHLVPLLYQNLDKIKSLVKNKIDKKIAVHYGCHFLKPSKIMNLGDPEQPTLLDEIVELVGAESVDYRDKQMCCGAGGGVRASQPEVGREMANKKVTNMKDAGAQWIVTPCPFCHLQFDREAKDGLPVWHISQLLALSFGIEKNKLGFEYHKIPCNDSQIR